MRNFGTLVSGTAAAQLINILFTLALARLYSPEAFGFLGIFVSVSSLGTTAAALKYDKALVLAKTDAEARAVRRLSFRLIVVISIVVTIGALVARKWILQSYSDAIFANVLLLSGLSVFMTAQIENLQYWLTRKTAFRVLARNRVLQSLLVGGTQLGFFFVFPGVAGLVAGLLMGTFLTLLVLKSKTPSVRGPLGDGNPTVREVAIRYRNLPLFYAPKGFVDSFRTTVISVSIGKTSVFGLGQYNMAYRMTMAPVSIVQAAMSQVLLQRLSTAARGSMYPVVRSSILKLGVLSLPFFGLFYLLAPWGFGLILGPEWREAGEFARALLPWIMMNNMSAPAANVFLVTNTQPYLLGLAVISALVPIFILGFSPLPLLGNIRALGAAMAGVELLNVLLAFAVASRYDSKCP